MCNTHHFVVVVASDVNIKIPLALLLSCMGCRIFELNMENKSTETEPQQQQQKRLKKPTRLTTTTVPDKK